MQAAVGGSARKTYTINLHYYFRKWAPSREHLLRPLAFLNRFGWHRALQFAHLSSALNIEGHRLLVKVGRKESSVEEATFEDWLAANPLLSTADHQVQSPERKAKKALLSDSSQNSEFQSNSGALNERDGNQVGEWDRTNWFEPALSVEEGGFARVVPVLPVQVPHIDWSKIGNGAPTVRACFLDSLKHYGKSSGGSLSHWRSFDWKETGGALQRLLDQGRHLHWCVESRSFVEVDSTTRPPVFAFVPPRMQSWEMSLGAVMTAEQFLDHVQPGHVSIQGTDAPAQRGRHPDSWMQLPAGEESTEGSCPCKSHGCPELQASDLPPVQSTNESRNNEMSSFNSGDKGLRDPSFPSSFSAQTKAGTKHHRMIRSTSPLCRNEKHLVILLTSAAAALCIWEDGRLARHNVITAYTVRAKQGKSQLNHMRGRTGGGLSV